MVCVCVCLEAERLIALSTATDALLLTDYCCCTGVYVVVVIMCSQKRRKRRRMACRDGGSCLSVSLT